MVLSRIRTQTRFVILPPSRLAVPGIFQRIELNNRRHDDMFAEMQRFRGRVYKEDGAIQTSELTSDGRHKLPIDGESWHILALDPHGHVVSCIRYLDESGTSSFDDLWVRHAALAKCPKLGRPFRGAVENEMDKARRMGIAFSEVGGWAVAEDYRWTIEPLRIILASYALAELLGGCCGVAMATFRHSSAMILRRIGLSPILADGGELPPYYDPQYRCQMEMLRFDSRRPNPKYRDWVSELSDVLMTVPVIGREDFVTSLKGLRRGFERPVEPALVPAAI
jgi:hypothetical protein